MVELSIVIITKDEEEDLKNCLESVKDIAKEIIVVDNYSTDKTIEIAQSYGCKIFKRRFDNFGNQKNFGISQAGCEWILVIDADEIITEELKKEIFEILTPNQKINGFYIPYEILYLGRKLSFGGCRNVSKLRLFRKDKGKMIGEIHEGLQVIAPTKKLKGKIIHKPYKNLKEHIEKIQLYASMVAEKKYKEGIRFRLWHSLIFPIRFFLTYFFKFGFLDSKAGFIWAVMDAYYHWLKFVLINDIKKNGS